MSDKSPHDEAREAQRVSLRERLLAERAIFAKSEAMVAATQSINDHMIGVLDALEPQCLGAYWPVRGEFSLLRALEHARAVLQSRIALAFSETSAQDGARMRFHLWGGATPTTKDVCGIPTGEGAAAEPDVVLVPCLGYTRSHYRMGYGGGYFDRWLAVRPHVTAVGVAWSGCELADSEFDARSHDVPLAVIVTERGVLA